MFDKKFRAAIRHFYKDRTNRVLSVIFIFLAVIFFTFFKNALIIVILITVTWLMQFYRRYVEGIHFGFDFTFMSTVVTAYAYGIIIGSFTGIACLFLTTLWDGRFTSSVFFAFFMLAMISFLASSFNSINITVLGITLAIIYDIVLYFSYMNFFGGKVYKGLIFAGTHIIFNIWAFIMVAPKLLLIM